MAVLDDVAALVRDRASGRVVVAVDGPDASGKTTFAASLGTRLGALVVSVDAWHHPRAVRMRRGDTSAEGYYRDAFNYPALVERLLDPFAAGASSVQVTSHDYRADVPLARTVTDVPDVLVVEGVFLLRPELRSRWGLSVHLHVPEEVTLARAEVRDLDLYGSREAVLSRYHARYLPGQRLYRAEADPLAAADVVLDNSDPAAPVVLRWPR